MGAVRGRLEAAGYSLPPVSAPVGSYAPAVVSGNHVWTSGQLPVRDGALAATGTVGEALQVDQAAELARLCCLNALAAIADQIGDLDAVVRVVKLTGYVASDPHFTAQAAVVNGASDLLGLAFGDAGVHARSAVGVAVLPLDAPVEIDLVVEVASQPAAS